MISLLNRSRWHEENWEQRQSSGTRIPPQPHHPVTLSQRLPDLHLNWGRTELHRVFQKCHRIIIPAIKNSIKQIFSARTASRRHRGRRRSSSYRRKCTKQIFLQTKEKLCLLAPLIRRQNQNRTLWEKDRGPWIKPFLFPRETIHTKQKEKFILIS